MSDWLGWSATALFTASYFFKRQSALRRVQMAAAALWMIYGAAVHATPVIVANLLVMSAAAVSSWNARSARSTDGLG
jgi:hypothetical protein